MVPTDASNDPVITPASADRDLDLATLRRIFARRWKVVAGTVVIATGLALGLTALQPEKFEAAVPLLLSGPIPAVGSSPAASVRMLLTAPVLLAEAAAQTPGTRIEPEDVFVDPVPNTPFVRVRVHDRDPERASAIAHHLSERAVAASRKLREEAFKPTGPADLSRLKLADAELRNAEQRLLEFRQESNIELLRREQEIRLEQQAGMIKLDIAIEAERARLAALDRPASQADARVAAESRGRLAALERQRARTRAARDLESKGRQELYRRELELRRLEQDYDLVRSSYATELARVRQVEPTVTPAIPLLELVERTAPPAYPVDRDRLRLTLLVLVSSFLLGVALVILMELIAWRVPADGYPQVVA